MPVNVTCSRCGQTYTRRTPSAAARSRYCSKACMHAVPPIIIDGEQARVPLIGRDGRTVRSYALIDATDAAWIGQWRWSLSHWGYAVRNDVVEGRAVTIRMSRDILGLTTGDRPFGDHINRDKLDNQRSNLRPTPDWGNSQNVPGDPKGTSKYRGVSWNIRTRKWQVRVKVHGETYCIGYFVSEEEAGEAARHARLDLMSFAVD